MSSRAALFMLALGVVLGFAAAIELTAYGNREFSNGMRELQAVPCLAMPPRVMRAARRSAQ